MSADVKGYCPMGCGRTLFLASGGYVTCSWHTCPNPSAAADLLLDAETEHVVHLEAKTFSIQHPLRERLNGDLWECGLHARLAALDGPPATPGRYRVHVGDRLTWTPLPEAPR